MVFLFFVIFIIVIILIATKSKSPKNNDFYNHRLYYDDLHDDLGDDFYDDCNRDYENYIEEKSTFAYPDPYTLPPESAIYLDEDGELLDDL